MPRVWDRQRRQAQVDFVWAALEASGASLLSRTDARRVPLYAAVMTPEEERFGVWLYPATLNKRLTRNRPADEFRLQLRYGGKEHWDGDTHMQRDLVETTLLLGIGIEDHVLVGLDPTRFNPLPLGDSIFFKQSDIDVAKATGWHVAHRRNNARKGQKDSADARLETLVFFTPDRLLDYVHFERGVELLNLDAASRARVASDAAVRRLRSAHEEFGLSSERLLQVVAKNKRLGVALRGSVAEEHLETQLQNRVPHDIAKVTQIDEDAKHDFDVELVDGRQFRVEVKNVSPKVSSKGLADLDLQKTRGKVPARLYTRDQFDVVAACLWPLTGKWEFRYQLTSRLRLHQNPEYAAEGRMASSQSVDGTWVGDLADL